MERRLFFGSVGAVLAGLVTRSEAVGKSVPVLEGLTDEGMAELIARFPQQGQRFMISSKWKLPPAGSSPMTSGVREGIDIYSPRSYHMHSAMHSVWRIEGTTIHNTTYAHLPRIPRNESIDIPSLSVIRVRPDRGWVEYRRISGNWFTISELADRYASTAKANGDIIDGRVDRTVYSFGPTDVLLGKGDPTAKY